jgi:hypothetical protein
MQIDALASRWSEYARRMPSSLEDLKGPSAGMIELPLHVAWSGRRVYDVCELARNFPTTRDWRVALGDLGGD